MAKRKNKMTQGLAVLQHLQKHGSITSMEAFELYGCTRLSARIYDFRHNLGLTIDSIDRTVKNRYGESCTYSEYVMAKEDRKKKL